ncbi:MAG TPA: hypothetical protein PKE64_21745 [Anaerolineae bacterium]|nr:hypothetical protein [Anaerolineae bacterium]HMR66646.1 hypothetical protein [Anaerolineae bacterium]
MSDMNKTVSEENENREANDMRSEYDFSDGVRGKHYQTYRQGHTVKIYRTDGNVMVQQFTLEDGAVFLEPDVREYFPDAEAVNKALRGLIALFPKD